MSSIQVPVNLENDPDEPLSPFSPMTAPRLWSELFLSIRGGCRFLFLSSTTVTSLSCFSVVLSRGWAIAVMSQIWVVKIVLVATDLFADFLQGFRWSFPYGQNLRGDEPAIETILPCQEMRIRVRLSECCTRQNLWSHEEAIWPRSFNQGSRSRKQ